MTENDRKRESVDMWNSVGWKRMIETRSRERDINREKHRQR
jgi:hypothetical protein